MLVSSLELEIYSASQVSASSTIYGATSVSFSGEKVPSIFKDFHSVEDSDNTISQLHVAV